MIGVLDRMYALRWGKVRKMIEKRRRWWPQVVQALSISSRRVSRFIHLLLRVLGGTSMGIEE